MKKASTPAEHEQAKNKRLVLGSLVVLLAAGGVFGGLSSLQRQAVPMTQEEQLAQRNKELQTTPPEQLAKSLERARILREKWRPWAEKNPGLLKTMLDAKPEDTAAMMAVWNAIPDSDFKGAMGISPKDLDPEGKIGNTFESGTVFGWSAFARVMYDQNRPGADPKQRGHATTMQGILKQTLQTEFLSHRDIVVARSINRGSKRVYLWASGRITEWERDYNSDLRPGDLTVAGRTNKEIEPPYDFLQ